MYESRSKSRTQANSRISFQLSVSFLHSSTHSTYPRPPSPFLRFGAASAARAEEGASPDDWCSARSSSSARQGARSLAAADATAAGGAQRSRGNTSRDVLPPFEFFSGVSENTQNSEDEDEDVTEDKGPRAIGLRCQPPSLMKATDFKIRCCDNTTSSTIAHTSPPRQKATTNSR